MSATDFVADAVNEAMDGDDAGDPQMGAGEAQGGEGTSESEGSSQEEAAPIAPAATFPSAAQASASGVTREELAAMHREQREHFAAENRRLREEFSRGNKKAEPEDQYLAEAEALHAKYTKGPGGYKAWTQDLAQDGSLLWRTMEAFNARGNAKHAAPLKAQEQKFNEYREQAEKEMADHRGYRRLMSHKYAESDKWKKYGKDFDEIASKGVINFGSSDEQVEAAINHAFEVAELRAKAKGATNAQAAAAGAQAAQAKAGQVATTKGKQPEPRDEASLRDGKRGTSAHAAPPATSGKGKKTSNDKWLESMIGNAVDQALKGK